MEDKQESHKRKPFVEPTLIKGERLYEVTFQPAGYADPTAHSATHKSFDPFPPLPFLSK